MSANPAPSSQTMPGAGAPIVIAQDLTKVFKDFWLRDRARAVDGITFHIDRGEIFGLLGPNGSGKSTTIKMILGLLRKTRGRLAVFSKPPSDVAVKRRIGYLPEESYLYPFLNARETLEYYGKLFHLERRVLSRRIDELLDMVGLAGVQHRQVREYSKGMQRRIGIAQALINDPEFLILDEPTTGLDPIGTRQIKDLIIHLGERGKTILLSSHLLSDVEDCVHRMVILYGGKIRAEGTCDDLLTTQTGSIIETESLDNETLAEIEAVLARRSRSIERVSRPRQRLEDLFISIVERAREQQLATSGALHGGETAAFLLGAAPPQAEGAALIDSLTRTEPATTEGAPATEPRPGAQPSAEPEPSTDASVIDELLRSSPGDSDTRTQRTAPDPAKPTPPRPAKPTEVDDDVIRSLLDRPDGEGRSDAESRS